jgi:hypothetical protein
LAVCDSCGLTLSETATFCPTCGATVAAASATSAAPYGPDASGYTESYSDGTAPSPPGVTATTHSQPRSSDPTEIAIAAGVLAAVVVVQALLGAGPVFLVLMAAWWCAVLWVGMRVLRVDLSTPRLLVTVAVLDVAQLVVGFVLASVLWSILQVAATSRHGAIIFGEFRWIVVAELIVFVLLDAAVIWWMTRARGWQALFVAMAGMLPSFALALLPSLFIARWM